MASALELMGQGVLYRTNYTPASAVGMMVADTVLGGGASYALGQWYARRHDKWDGKHAPELVGAVGKIAELGLTIFFGPGWLSGLAGSVGQSGVNARLLQMGIEHAFKAQKRHIVALPPGVDPKALGDNGKDTLLGADGVGLPDDAVETLSSMS